MADLYNVDLVCCSGDNRQLNYGVALLPVLAFMYVKNSVRNDHSVYKMLSLVIFALV
jgi:hypothetical protein